MELIISEEQIIKETQEIAFAKEIAALKKGKPVATSGSLLKLNPMLENEYNSRIQYYEMRRKFRTK
jgi:hypothetical protein